MKKERGDSSGYHEAGVRDQGGHVVGAHSTGRDDWNKWEKKNKMPFVSTYNKFTIRLILKGLSCKNLSWHKMCKRTQDLNECVEKCEKLHYHPQFQLNLKIFMYNKLLQKYFLSIIFKCYPGGHV